MFTEEELASVRGAARRSLIVTEHEPAPRERSSLVLPYNPCVSPREGVPASELVCRSRSCSRSHSPVHL